MSVSYRRMRGHPAIAFPGATRAFFSPSRLAVLLLLGAALWLTGCASEEGSEGSSAPGDVPDEAETMAEPSPEINLLIDAPPALLTHERGGEAVFFLMLDGAPAQDWVFSLRTSDAGEGRVFPETMVFSENDWETPQTVTVTGVDDDEDDGNQTYSISIEPVLQGLTEVPETGGFSIEALNADDDSPGVTVQLETMSFSEANGEGWFKVMLNTEPDGDVAVEVGCTDPSEALFVDGDDAAAAPLLSEILLIFTPEDWSVPQDVLMIGQDDDQVDGDQVLDISIRVDRDATTDTTGYADLEPQGVEVVVTDDDVEGITVQILRNCSATRG